MKYVVAGFCSNGVAVDPSCLFAGGLFVPTIVAMPPDTYAGVAFHASCDGARRASTTSS